MIFQWSSRSFKVVHGRSRSFSVEKWSFNRKRPWTTLSRTTSRLWAFTDVHSRSTARFSYKIWAISLAVRNREEEDGGDGERGGAGEGLVLTPGGCTASGGAYIILRLTWAGGLRRRGRRRHTSMGVSPHPRHPPSPTLLSPSLEAGGMIWIKFKIDFMLLFVNNWWQN